MPACPTNYEQAEPGRRIEWVVIHDIEGTATGAIRWFQNPTSKVSAHYVIDYDGTITQMVADRDVAWQAGNREVNLHSIGIEHSGFADKNNWTDRQYLASARLVRWLCLAYNIPLDRSHIIGHSEVPDPADPKRFGGRNHHTDPGRYFDWPRFMAMVVRSEIPARRAP